MFPNDEPHPGDFVKFVVGNARAPFICDQCGKEFASNAPVVAFSIWGGPMGISYIEWEHNYLIPVVDSDPQWIVNQSQWEKEVFNKIALRKGDL
jgi:hypothetical protein